MRRSRGSVTWLTGLVATGVLVVSGCSGGGSGGGSTTASNQNLEIFTYWTAGGEADAVVRGIV